MTVGVVDEICGLIDTYKNAKADLITEREVINGKLTAVGEFINDI